MSKKDTALESTVETPVRWGHGWQKIIIIIGIKLHTLVSTRLILLLRCPNDNTEWQLDPVVFEKLCEVLHIPVIDLLASAINKQTSEYVSRKPDPQSWAIDAFTIQWKNINFHAFSSF